MTEETINVEEELADAKAEAAGITEKMSVAGSDLVATIQALLREGAVRKITIKDNTGRTLLEFPLYAGVVGALVFGSWTVVALIAAWFTEVSIIIERDLASDDHTPALSGEFVDRAAGTVKSTTQTATGTVSDVFGGAARSASDLARRAADSLEERLQMSGAVKEAVDEVVESAEAAAEPQQCVALTKAGTRCKRTAVTGSDYCSTHQPLAN